MSQKRKIVHNPRTRATRSPRAVVPAGPPTVTYPSAQSLLASATDWRLWLDDKLRGLLRPAALVGALGVAAAGCGTVFDPYATAGAPPTVMPTTTGPSAPKPGEIEPPGPASMDEAPRDDYGQPPQDR